MLESIHCVLLQLCFEALIDVSVARRTLDRAAPKMLRRGCIYGAVKGHSKAVFTAAVQLLDGAKSNTVLAIY